MKTNLKTSKIVLAVAMQVCVSTALCQAKPEASRRTTAVVLPEGKSPYTILSLPGDAGEDILGAILAAQKGKAVFVDFWATWCGPCIAAITAMHEVKPRILEKGVAMIYITGESSPAEKWEQAIQRIGANHYYLTKEQWAAVCTRQGIKGIPFYMIFDRAGKMTYRSTGFPGNDKIMEELAKVW